MREKELRLALVCYGGVSLAVYMHGITGETWRLARASCAFHDGSPASRGSQGVYRALLEEIASETGIRLRILVDIVAGASAGGDQRYLPGAGDRHRPVARSANHDVARQCRYRSVARSRRGAGPVQANYGRRRWHGWRPTVTRSPKRSTARRARSRAQAAPVHPRALVRAAVRRGAADQHGARRAARNEGGGRAGRACSPPAQPLDLFVTVTDFRGHPERLRLNSPPEVVETEHRLVFHFCEDGEGAIGGPLDLATAARATSSFPGAFPPVTVAEIDAVAKQRKMRWPGRKAFLARMLRRHDAIGGAEAAVLIDGSVLANAPFRPALDALRDRPARRQIDRRFVYIDPTPGYHMNLGVAKAESPGFFQTIIGALSELPRQQPIRDNLEAIEARTTRVTRMRAILEGLRDEVEAAVLKAYGMKLFLDYPHARAPDGVAAQGADRRRQAIGLRLFVLCSA